MLCHVSCCALLVEPPLAHDILETLYTRPYHNAISMGIPEAKCSPNMAIYKPIHVSGGYENQTRASWQEAKDICNKKKPFYAVTK